MHCFEVCFDEVALSWEAFRGDVVGATDPVKARKDSLRGRIFAGWEGLGLTAQPR